MKRVLITGANSYIGRSFMNYVAMDSEFSVEELDVRDNGWKDFDFSRFDTIFHVAGIAHFSKDKSKKELYYKVNTELTEEVAQKAKSEGVSRFIFMSSIIVYGDSKKEIRVISNKTVPRPTDFYGDSKLQAELRLNELSEGNFKVVVLRPPMIYGKGSKGNYPKLSYLAQKTPIFPKIKNQRSMLHIDNLCEFLKQIILKDGYGLYFPQNKEYVNTTDLVCEIAKQYNKKLLLTEVFNPLISLLFGLDSVKKAFGSLVYHHEMSQYEFEYQIRNFAETIKITEEK